MLLSFSSCHFELAGIQITVLMEDVGYRDENIVKAKHVTYTLSPSTQEAVAGLWPMTILMTIAYDIFLDCEMSLGPAWDAE